MNNFFSIPQVQIIIAGLLGCLMHILVKVQTINADLKDQTYSKVFEAYWKYDWPAVLICILFVFTLSYLADELLPLNISEEIAVRSTPGSVSQALSSSFGKVVKLASFSLSLVADWAINLWIGKTKDKLRSLSLMNGASLADITPLPKAIQETPPAV